MKEKALLSKEQLLCLLFIGVIGNIVYVHTWIDDDADRAMWVAALAGILAVIPLAVAMLRLGGRCEGKTLLDSVETGLGKTVAAAVSLVYAAVNTGLAAVHISMFTGLINTFFLQYTPSWIIMANIVVMGALFAAGGIVTLARWVELMLGLGLVNYFSTFAAALPIDFRIEYVVPVFNTTAAGFLRSAFFISGNAAETLLLLAVLVGFMTSPKKKTKSVVWGVAAASVVFSVAIMFINGIMSPELAKRIAFGGVNAARLIKIAQSIEGLEVFILMTYQLIAVSKVTLFLFCAWTALKRIFRGKIPIVLLIAVSAAMLAASLSVASYNNAFELAVLAASYVTLPFSLLLIALAALGAVSGKCKAAGAGGGT